jgi:hypothetical protein
MKPPLKCLPLFLIPWLLGGCLPFPHFPQRSPEFQGRALDARTHAPVQGAKVFLTDRPSVSCKTDSSGNFRLGATHKFQISFLMLLEARVADWPSREEGYTGLTVSHTNYQPSGFFYQGDTPIEALLEPERPAARHTQ